MRWAAIRCSSWARNSTGASSGISRGFLPLTVPVTPAPDEHLLHYLNVVQ